MAPFLQPLQLIFASILIGPYPFISSPTGHLSLKPNAGWSVLGVVRGANAGGDFKLLFQGSREVARIINLMLKMNVRLEPAMIFGLMASPQWDLQDGLLP
jgi:hypothetical protein